MKNIKFVLGLLPIIVFGSWLSVCNANESQPAKNLEDIHAASCRVMATRGKNGSGAVGTGTVCLKADGKYWILTNWHVVNGCDTLRLDFFGTGKKYSCHAQLEGSWYDPQAPYDFAVLSVLEKDLAPYDPPYVPLASAEARPQEGEAILSSGCSEGRWSMAWKGCIESYYGNTAQFAPAPKGGQSGSAIIQNVDGELKIVGILTWRVGDERNHSEERMRGGAIPISLFYSAVSGRKKMDGGKNVPPYAAWCQDGISSEKFAKENLRLLFFHSSQCQPCHECIPVLDELKQKGYEIEDHSLDTDDGKKYADDWGVRQLPTFILLSDQDNTIRELSRMEGNRNVRKKLFDLFRQYEKELEESSREESGPAKTMGKADNVSPLIERYQGTDPTRSIRNNGENSESGLIGNAMERLTNHLQKKIDIFEKELRAKIESEFSAELTEFLSSVLLRAVLCIVLFQLILSFLVSGLNQGIRCLFRFFGSFRITFQTTTPEVAIKSENTLPTSSVKSGKENVL